MPSYQANMLEGQSKVDGGYDVQMSCGLNNRKLDEVNRCHDNGDWSTESEKTTLKMTQMSAYSRLHTFGPELEALEWQ